VLRSSPLLTTSLAAALVLPLFAQQEPERPTLQANVPLVLAPVTVTDKKGNFIDGLTVDDFRLTDEGRPQKIRMDTSDTVLAPVSLVVLIQASGISAPALARIERVGGLIKPLVIGERGQAAVMEFDNELRLRTDFTTDSGAIRAAFLGTRSRGIRAARLIDAVAEGVRMLDTRAPNNRRVMLILSESRDRGSKTSLAAAVEFAQRAGVVVYPATYSVQASAFASSPSDSPSMPVPDDPAEIAANNPAANSAGRTSGNSAGTSRSANSVDLLGGALELGRIGKANAADALARATGGRHLSFVTLGTLENVISRAGEEIHSQYLLSFVPQSSGKEGPHQIQVAIPSRPDAVIRVRPRYWPQK
jgi:VWFA-related protein